MFCSLNTSISILIVIKKPTIMKVKNLLFCSLFFCCVLGMQSLNAQLVEKATITDNEANFKMISPDSYLMEIAGPNDYYFRQEIASTNNISLSNVDMEGKKFADGTYKMQVTPIVTLSETTRQELATLRKKNDQEKIAAFRLEHELPEAVNVYNISFSIRNGKFVSPNQQEAKGVNLPKMSGLIWKQDLLLEQDHPVLYASINNIDVEYGKPVMAANAAPLVRDNTPMFEDDQQFLDDVIVVGSICVGQDCNNGESFGFDTGRYKENNLRIHFDDTSNSASFPSNDWRITINDSSNGGSSYFAIEDATAGNVPFRIEAGAGANALYVDDGGRVGIGTAAPVVEMHMTDGDSPTMRLEQNGSSGFTPQIWDIAGNETNFFVRDVSNGSKLPFKIFPNAPTNALTIETSTGDIGLGTTSPSSPLHVRRTNGTSAILVEDASGTAGFRTMATFNSTAGGGVAFRMTNGSHSIDYNNTGVVGSEEFRINHVDGDSQELSLDQAGNLTITGTLTTATQTIPDYVFADDYKLLSLEELKAFIEKEKHLPNIPSESEIEAQGKKVDLSLFQMLLLEKIEELTLYTLQQQETIDLQEEEIVDLKAQLTKMESLETQLAELSKMVSALNKTHNSSVSSDNTVEEKE